MIIRILAGLAAAIFFLGPAWAEDMRGTWDIETYQVDTAVCSGLLQVRERTPEGGYLGRLVLRYQTPAERLEVSQDVELTRSGELWAVDGRDPVVESSAVLSRSAFGYQGDRFLCTDVWPEVLECVVVRVGLADWADPDRSDLGQVPLRMIKAQ